MINPIENSEKVFEIEAFAKDGKHIPIDPGAVFKFRIDKNTYLTEKRFLSGRELLEIAGKIPPENFRIDMIIHGGRPRKIELSEKVDLAEFGVERFVTMPLDPTEG